MTRKLRLAGTVWLEVELSAAILMLPLANGDLALEIGLLRHAPSLAILAAFVAAVAGTFPLAIWGRPVAKGFRGWR